MKYPWLKFYPADWRADEKLRMCSLASRGLWIEMLAIMHRSERYGQLLISGKAPTDTQLALLVGASPDEVSALITELGSSGVFSRTAKGVIYSRRMTRDHRKAETARKNGSLGGNPTLSKKTGNSGLDNQEDKAPDKLRSQKPDTVPIGTGPQPELAKQIFDVGVKLLVSAGSDDRQARSMIGRWRKDQGDAAVIASLVAAKDQNILQPIEWIQARFGRQGSAGNAALYAQAQKLPGRTPIKTEGR
jgi:hypothetical protein